MFLNKYLITAPILIINLLTLMLIKYKRVNKGNKNTIQSSFFFYVREIVPSLEQLGLRHELK
jgi:hypothetical protein